MLLMLVRQVYEKGLQMLLMLVRQVYEKELHRYGDLDSVEYRRRQSRLDFFLIEAESMGWDSTLQAMSYAMEMVEEIEGLERPVSGEEES